MTDENVKGVVKSIKEMQGPNKKFYIIDLGLENTYSTFTEPTFKEGDRVSIDYVEKKVGDRIYRNISFVEVLFESKESKNSETKTIKKTQVETFTGLSLEEFKVVYNELSKSSTIMATQPFQKEDKYDFIVYYI